VAMTVVAVAATEATVARAGIATAARAAEGDHDGSQGDSEAQRLRGSEDFWATADPTETLSERSAVWSSRPRRQSSRAGEPARLSSCLASASTGCALTSSVHAIGSSSAQRSVLV